MENSASILAAYKLIRAITDDSSFIETLTLVQGKSLLGEAAGEGVISGFATIDDIQVGIFANNSEVLSGSIGKRSAKKISKTIEDAVKMNVPVIGILDTSGARFAEGIKAMEGYGGIIKALNLAYGNVPTIMILKGNCFGMASYLAASCDFCIAFDKARLATSSPLILAAQTKVDTDKVGTAKVHYEETGIVSRIVSDEAELRDCLRNMLDYLMVSEKDSVDNPNRVCNSLCATSSMRDIITESMDKNSFFEIKSEFAKEVVVGFARLNGMSVGIIATDSSQNERLTDKGARKITDFVSGCILHCMPIVNFVDCKGVENNLQSENGTLIKDVADMLYSYNVSDNAKISVITGNAIGLGYVAFASKRSVDYSIAWDSAYIGMLDSVATANLIYGDQIAAAKDKASAEAELAKSYAEENCSASAVAESGYIDNVILPPLTRQYLIAAVMMFSAKR